MNNFFTNILRSSVLVYSLLLVNFMANATDTYERVHSIIQTKCAATCHSYGTPSGQLILQGDAATMYSSLVGVMPTNPAAQAKGYKQVVAGQPDQSYLFKKIHGGMEHNFALVAAEGNPMPPVGAAQLSTTERELIRQWILFGAPQTGEVVSEALINDFYDSGVSMVTPLPIPNPSEGFQIHHGPIFMEPGHELEAFRKIDLTLPDSLDIVGFDIAMNPESHHFIIYQYHPTLTTPIPPGVRISNGFSDEVIMYQNADFLDIWQFVEPHHVPNNAAFKWSANTAIDFNYHIKNYSAINPLAAEAYINVYTQPSDPNRRPIKFSVSPLGGFNPFVLQLPPTNTDTSIVSQLYSEQDEWIAIWKLQGHTHKLGKDYDVYLRNADGTRGEQIYEGYNDPTNTFNQGYYDYSHPPVLKTDPMMCLNLKNGLWSEAVYNNNTGETVGFGLTTNEEMFITYYNYVDLDPSEIPCLTLQTAIEQPHNHLNSAALSALPNPSAGVFKVQLHNTTTGNTQLRLYNMLGEMLAEPLNTYLSAGDHTTLLDAQHLPNGMYVLQLQNPQGSSVLRLVKND